MGRYLAHDDVRRPSESIEHALTLKHFQDRRSRLLYPLNRPGRLARRVIDHAVDISCFTRKHSSIYKYNPEEPYLNDVKSWSP
jgi:hypothetical protein